MTRTLLRRLILSIPLLFVVTVLTFVVTGLTPGSVAATILGTNATTGNNYIAATHPNSSLLGPAGLLKTGTTTPAAPALNKFFAAASACSRVVATSPRGTATPYFFRIPLAWYS